MKPFIKDLLAPLFGVKRSIFLYIFVNAAPSQINPEQKRAYVSDFSAFLNSEKIAANFLWNYCIK